MFVAGAPLFYNNLDAALNEAWRQLERGCNNRNAPFHTPVVCTLNDDGCVDGRTMVLRHVDPQHRILHFHTDVRSAKARSRAQSGSVAVVGYDSRRKLQLRLRGTWRLDPHSSQADEAWNGASLTSRRCYLSEQAPSVRAAEPTSGLPQALQNRAPSAAESELGRVNFALIIVDIIMIDWLYLAHEGHRRALFDWSDGSLRSSWLVP